MSQVDQLRRDAIALAQAQSAVGKCCHIMGDVVTNRIGAQINSFAMEVQDKLEIAMAKGL